MSEARQSTYWRRAQRGLIRVTRQEPAAMKSPPETSIQTAACAGAQAGQVGDLAQLTHGTKSI
jgi:hypothetical protein